MQTGVRTMRAFAIFRFRDPGSVAQLPVPSIGENEILVRVHAAGVNPFDWKMRDGMFGGSSFPLVLGRDFAGVVERAGANVTRFAEGDRVFGASDGGSFADYTAAKTGAPNDVTAQIPDGVDDVHAAALPVAGLTALSLVNAAGAGPGKTMLIVGAAGGVGTYAVQLATARGARVVAVVHSSQADIARTLGASDAVAYDRGDTVEHAGGVVPDGYDGVIDVVTMGEGIRRFAGVIRPGGTIVSPISAIDEAWFAQRKLTGKNVGMMQAPAPIGESLEMLARMVASDKLTVHVDAERMLEDAARALDDLRAGRVGGKMVLRVCVP